MHIKLSKTATLLTPYSHSRLTIIHSRYSHTFELTQKHISSTTTNTTIMTDKETSTLQSYVDTATGYAQSALGSVTGSQADKVCTNHIFIVPPNNHKHSRPD